MVDRAATARQDRGRSRRPRTGTSASKQHQRHHRAGGVELPQPGIRRDDPHIIVGKSDDGGIDQDQPGGGKGLVGGHRQAVLSAMLSPIKPAATEPCALESDMSGNGSGPVAVGRKRLVVKRRGADKVGPQAGPKGADDGAEEIRQAGKLWPLARDARGPAARGDRADGRCDVDAGRSALGHGAQPLVAACGDPAEPRPAPGGLCPRRRMPAKRWNWTTTR